MINEAGLVHGFMSRTLTLLGSLRESTGLSYREIMRNMLETLFSDSCENWGLLINLWGHFARGTQNEFKSKKVIHYFY